MCVVLLALLTLSWGYFVYTFARDYRSIEKQCSDNVSSLAIGLETHTRQVLRGISLLLLDIERHFTNHPPLELQSMFSAWIKRTPELAALAVIDSRSGEVLFSHNGFPFASSPFESTFVAPAGKEHSLQIADDLYRGPDGQNLVALFRQDQRGERPLLAVALLQVDHLLGFHPETTPGPNGSAAIFHHSGLLLARRPHGEQLVGRFFSAGPLFSEILPESSEGVNLASKSTDGVSRIVAYRKLADFPLVVTVGIPIDRALADWQSRLLNSLMIQIAVSLTVVLSLVMLVRTLSRVEKAKLELEEREEHFRSVANSSVDAVISVNHAERIRFWSLGAEHIFNCPSTEAYGMPISCFLHFVTDGNPLTLNQLLENVLPGASQRTFEIQGQRKNGEEFPTELSISRGIAAGQSLFTLIVRDVTERKQMEERIRRLASHDNLTGLPNRGLLMDRLDVAMAQVRRQGGQFALLFIDLDKFKPVNDNYGHDAGDRLLKQATQRMLDTVRASDTVARVGGDEFAVLLSNVEDEVSVSRACETLLAALRRKFSVSGHQVMISCSIGVAFYHGQEQTAVELLGRADIAMYAAKRAGKNRYAFADS